VGYLDLSKYKRWQAIDSGRSLGGDTSGGKGDRTRSVVVLLVFQVRG